jgi:cyanophycinase
MNYLYHYSITLAGILLLFTFASCAQPGEQRDDIEAVSPDAGARGNLVMLGGGPRPDAIMQRVVELSRDGHLIVVPMASSIPDTIGMEHRDQLLGYGAAEVDIMMLEESDIDSGEILQQLREAGGIWFSGGGQRRLMHFFDTPDMRAAVHEAYKNGAVIAGTSAGTAVQSASMITGDEAHAFSDYFGQIRHENVITTPGLGLVENMVVDQHFIRRSRLNRLINILLDDEAEFAVGIDEATALWIGPEGRAEIWGESQVILISAEGVDPKVYDDRYLGATGLELHVLPAGSQFSWRGNKVRDIRLPE